MPRTKKQKLSKRTQDDNEDARCYDVVLKDSILLKEPANTHGRVVLYGDIIIDMNTFISNQKYSPKL